MKFIRSHSLVSRPSGGHQLSFVGLGIAVAVAAALLGNPTRAEAQDQALFVTIAGQYDLYGARAFDMLVTAGADADHVVLNSNGMVAAAIQAAENGGNAYDQIWIYDLSWLGTDPYPDDYQAIVAWFNSRLDPELICDGRFLGSYLNNTWNVEGRALAENYYVNLAARGGGLLLATDHDVFANYGINDIAALLGIDPFIGNFGGAFPVDPANPLMTTPNDLTGGLANNTSTGQAPFNLQPNGLILHTVGYHSGNTETPGLSSTIDGSLNFTVTIDTPESGSELCTPDAVLAETSVNEQVDPVSYEWSSNIDGFLGTGPTLLIDSLALSEGTHTITVLAEDNSGLFDDDEITIIVCAQIGEPNVPDGEQVGSMTTGILRQPIPTPAPGTTCTAGIWSGKRSDGAGTWGMWAMQITNGTYVWNILPTERLAFQTEEWEFFERADFTIPAWLGTTLYFQLNGYFGWESFDDVSLDCGSGNVLLNPSFELPPIPDGEWSPAFGNPPPEDWIRINGSGHFNPNTTQFNDIP